MQVNISFVVRVDATWDSIKTLYSSEIDLDFMPRVGDSVDVPALIRDLKARYPSLEGDKGVVLESGTDIFDIQRGSPYLVVVLPIAGQTVKAIRRSILERHGWI